MVSHKKQERAEKSAAPKVRPRRGRPNGKNRKPLSREEKRARNAQYERERREETATAMVDLADAVGGDRDMSNQELLIAAIRFIQERTGGTDVEDLQRQIDIMEAQVLRLSLRLALHGETIEEPIPQEALSALPLTEEHMRQVWSHIERIRDDVEQDVDQDVEQDVDQDVEQDVEQDEI